MAMRKRARTIGYKVQVTDHTGQKPKVAEEVVSSIAAAGKLLVKNLQNGCRSIVVYPTRDAVTAKSSELAQAAIEVELMGFPKPQQ